jgi:hypothetical protein
VLLFRAAAAWLGRGESVVAVVVVLVALLLVLVLAERSGQLSGCGGGRGGRADLAAVVLLDITVATIWTARACCSISRRSAGSVVASQSRRSSVSASTGVTGCSVTRTPSSACLQ